jgi:nickel-dependent lactate racemase
MQYSLKYGQGLINIDFGDHHVDVITSGAKNQKPLAMIEINFQPMHDLLFKSHKKRSELVIGIAINDKTRPVPYSRLIPPLINELINSGIHQKNIYFYIANGTHVPDYDYGYLNLKNDILNSFTFIQHNCQDDLVHLGTTSFGTPIQINRSYYQCDIKISVGNIEPHHFAGYSGGVKTVSIGLAGKETINHNHALLMDANSVACKYQKNKVRMDIEEIGDMIGVDLALNCIQTKDLEILHVFFDQPGKVMQLAIPIIDSLFSVSTDKKYDIVVASAGGYPKDINFYQSQKATSNAGKILNNNGTMLLIAECREGPGSDAYYQYVNKFSHPSEVISDFENKNFVIGQHKAYLMAKLQSRYKIFLYSSMANEIVKKLMMEPVVDLQKFFNYISSENTHTIALMPNAVTTIPII